MEYDTSSYKKSVSLSDLKSTIRRLAGPTCRCSVCKQVICSILHYSDVIMSARAPQITGVSIVYSTVCSGANQRKHQSSESLAFARGIHRWSVNSPHKGPVTWRMFPFDGVIISACIFIIILSPLSLDGVKSIYHTATFSFEQCYQILITLLYIFWFFRVLRTSAKWNC